MYEYVTDILPGIHVDLKSKHAKKKFKIIFYPQERKAFNILKGQKICPPNLLSL